MLKNVKKGKKTKRMMEDKKENILVLSLSTLKDKYLLSKYTYSYGKDKTIVVEGYYQMESVPRILSKLLQEEYEEQLDYIIALATDETRTSKIFQEGTNEKTCTAEEYFRDRVSEKDKNGNASCTAEIICINVKKKNGKNETDKTEDCDDAIEQLIGKIRDIGKKGKPCVYLDTHGGFRDFALVIPGILSLLQLEGIEIKDVFGIRNIYNKETNVTDYNIISVQDKVNIFQFMSGMDEFVNHGQAESLEKFLRNRKGSSELVTIIEKIAYGIQLCDIRTFEDGLADMRKYYHNSTSEERTDTEDPYISLFRETIRSGYGELLGSTPDVGTEIQWCLKKGFLQQALTLVESKLPELLSEKGILTYNENGIDVSTLRRETSSYQTDTDFCYNTTLPKIVRAVAKKLVSNALQQNCDFNQDILEQLAEKLSKPCVCPWEKEEVNAADGEKDGQNEKEKQCVTITIPQQDYEEQLVFDLEPKPSQQKDHVTVTLDFYGTKTPVFCKLPINRSGKQSTGKKQIRFNLPGDNAIYCNIETQKKKRYVMVEYNLTRYNDYQKQLFCKFVILHTALKNVRNTCNHGADSGVDIDKENLVNGIQDYIALGRKLGIFCETEAE
jgi:hypothetical protein